VPDSDPVSTNTTTSFLAFVGSRRLAADTLAEVAVEARRALETGGAGVLIFSTGTGRIIDLDLRGGEAEVRARYALEPPAKRGRPRLGVVAREVTLLPRHWDWLASQPGGASVALRKLVEAARKADAGLMRERIDAAYRFMSAMAGDLPRFEDAARSLYKGDNDRLADCMTDWPPDIRDAVVSFLGTTPIPSR
jgi:uncharacterized protein